MGVLLSTCPEAGDKLWLGAREPGVRSGRLGRKSQLLRPQATEGGKFHFAAPSRKPGSLVSEDSPVKIQAIVSAMVSKWCRMSSVYSMLTNPGGGGGGPSSYGIEVPRQACSRNVVRLMAPRRCPQALPVLVPALLNELLALSISGLPTRRFAHSRFAFPFF